MRRVRREACAHEGQIDSGTRCKGLITDRRCGAKFEKQSIQTGNTHEATGMRMPRYSLTREQCVSPTMAVRQRH